MPSVYESAKGLGGARRGGERGIPFQEDKLLGGEGPAGI